jgi:SDR family mycofactocin-dependent oxidoreductase
MGKVESKVALVTGAARGQGRSHAVRLAREGADIIALDICADIATMDYPNASPADFEETVKLIEGADRRIVARRADVRDAAAVKAVAEEGFAEFGRIDIVLSNAGIVRLGPCDDETGIQLWQDILATNLTGTFHVLRAVVPHMIESGRGGVIILTGSTAGVRPVAPYTPGYLAYTAAKFGLVGIGKHMAYALAEHSIRVNVVHPTGVASGMTMNSAMESLHANAASRPDDGTISHMQNALPIDMLQPEDISDAIVSSVPIKRNTSLESRCPSMRGSQ